MIKFCAFVPHPPVVIPEIATQQDSKLVKHTAAAMEQLASKLTELEIDTVIIISPHGVVYPDRMNVWSGGEFSGDFAKFGVKDIKFDFASNDDLAQDIINSGNDSGVATNNYQENHILDHGILIPMYFLRQYLPEDVKLVPINYSMQDRLAHFTFGQIINEVCNSAHYSDKEIAIIASGDLSHRLFEGDAGVDFDKQIVDDLKAKDVQSILQIDDDFLADAGECGYRSLLILLGTLEGLDFTPEILSYEGPFGIGYLVANFKITSQPDQSEFDI